MVTCTVRRSVSGGFLGIAQEGHVSAATGERVWENPVPASGSADGDGASPPVRAGTRFRSAQDAASGLTFYVDVATSATVWDLPEGAVVVEQAAAAAAAAMSQWSSAVDPASGEKYYYNASGDTRWEAPTDA